MGVGGRYTMCLFYYPVKPLDIFYALFITQIVGNSLVVQWLGLHIFTAWIQCLVRELIFHTLQKKKKKVIKGNKSYPQRESNNGRRTGEEDQKES